jgi:hypothetical protein
MTQSPKAAMRLAPVQEPGANLYNSYNYLTQLSALYAAAVGFDHHELARSTWEELCDLVLQDLGDLYSAWETVLNKGKSGIPMPDDPVLGNVIVRACRRADVLLRHLNVWTPIQRVARLLYLCERRWQNVIVGLAKECPDLGAPLAQVHESSLDRSSRLTGFIEKYRQEELRMGAAMRLAQSSLAKAGGGI